MKIAANRMDRIFYVYQDELEHKVLEVLRSGWYILGNEVNSFEKEFAQYTGAGYCVGVASGLDALWIAFKALGIGSGDEVLVQGNTYIASVMGITINGAKPVFIEPDVYYNIDADLLEKKNTEHTKAILVVHLYGQSADMKKIMDIAHRYDLRVVEDCAQAHGATYNDKQVGTFGDIGCFSFYPSKNLGAYGDAGAIVTDDPQIANFVKIFRNYGSEKRYYNQMIGANSRLDELQAGLLRVKLKYLDSINEEKRKIAEKYSEQLKNSKIELPKERANVYSVWHQYVIRCGYREKLIEYLHANGVETLIHYPVPPHRAEAYRYLGIQEGELPITERYAGQVLSIPIYNGMTDEEQEYVIDIMNKF